MKAKEKKVTIDFETIPNLFQLMVCYSSLMEDVTYNSVLLKINDDSKQNNKLLINTLNHFADFFGYITACYFYNNNCLNNKEIILEFLDECASVCDDESEKEYFYKHKNNIDKYLNACNDNALCDFINKLETSEIEKIVYYTEINDYLYYSKLKLNNYIEPRYTDIIMNTFTKIYIKRLPKEDLKEYDYLKEYRDTMDTYLSQKFIKQKMFPKLFENYLLIDKLDALDEDEYNLFVNIIICQVSNQNEQKRFNYSKFLCKKMNISIDEYLEISERLYEDLYEEIDMIL